MIRPSPTQTKLMFAVFCGAWLSLAQTPDTTAEQLSQPVAEHARAEAEEKLFQEDVNRLFNACPSRIDTTGWCTTRINGAWFDYTKLTDTLRIPLVDSLQRRYFTFPFANYVTSQFGPRSGFWHFGVDIKVRVGDTIRCALDGMVRIIRYDRYGYGNVVVVRHHNGLETLYGHLSRLLVKGNQELKSGEAIGLGGSTGRTTGSHLHFEMRYCGEPFDPNGIIDFTDHALRSDTLILTGESFAYLTEVRKTVCHRVRPGETLSGLARRYGTSVSRLCALNGISSQSVLSVGRRLIIRKGGIAETRPSGQDRPSELKPARAEKITPAASTAAL